MKKTQSLFEDMILALMRHTVFVMPNFDTSSLFSVQENTELEVKSNLRKTKYLSLGFFFYKSMMEIKYICGIIEDWQVVCFVYYSTKIVP